MMSPSMSMPVRRASGIGIGVLFAAMLALLCAAGVARAATTPIFYATGLSTGQAPTWAEPVDITGDGHLDLVVANGDDNSVTVSLGDGHGHFGPPTAYSTGGVNPYSLDVAELTGDGKLDVAVANRTSATVTVLKGDGAGGFTFLRSLVVGTETIDVKAIDLDDDGDLDLASTEMWSSVTHLDGTLWLLYNNGSGVFKTVDMPLPFDGGTVLGVGDLNEDGSVDVAVGHSYWTSTSILLNDGLGVHLNADNWPITNLVPAAPLSVGPLPQGSVFADFNADGHQDICVTSRHPNYANIFFGDGSGAFTGPTTYSVGAYAKVPTAVDLNGDGVLDLAICNYGNEGEGETGGTTISILTGNSNGTFNAQTTVNVGVRPHSIGVGDFNEDGWPDLAVPNWASDDVSVLLNMTPYAADDDDPITTSSADSAWHAGAVTVTLTATDAASGVALTKYRIDGGSWQDYATGFAIASEGDHTVQYYSVDRMGNQESTRTAHVKIDGTPPATTSSADSAWHAGPVTVTLTPADAVSGVAQTSYRVDGAAWQTGTSFVISADGDHTIQYYSVDAAGNQETTQTAHVKIDATSPEVTVTRPAVDAKYPQGDGVTCAWTASDATSGLASEVATIDGVPVAKGDPIDAVAEGAHTFVLTVTDVAGRQQIVTVQYSVPVPDPTSFKAAASVATVTWGKKVTLRATLTDTGTGGALAGQQVRLESSADKTAWKLVRTVTSDAAGVCASTVGPRARTYYRFAYGGDADYEHAAAESAPTTVKVRPALGRPQAPRTTRARARFTVKGSLKPRFTRGAKTVRISIYRARSGKWVLAKKLRAVNANSGSYSKYTLKLRLSARGKYRFKATTGTSSTWAPAVSSYSRTMVVK